MKCFPPIWYKSVLEIFWDHAVLTEGRGVILSTVFSIFLAVDKLALASDVSITFYFPRQDLLTCHSVSASDMQYPPNVRCWWILSTFSIWAVTNHGKARQQWQHSRESDIYLFFFPMLPYKVVKFLSVEMSSVLNTRGPSQKGCEQNK